MNIHDDNSLRLAIDSGLISGLNPTKGREYACTAETLVVNINYVIDLYRRATSGAKESTPSAPSNSDYAAAQRVLREYYISYDGTQTVNDLQTFVTVRLNAEKDAHCA